MRARSDESSSDVAPVGMRERGRVATRRSTRVCTGEVHDRPSTCKRHVSVLLEAQWNAALLRQRTLRAPTSEGRQQLRHPPRPAQTSGLQGPCRTALELTDRRLRGRLTHATEADESELQPAQDATAARQARRHRGELASPTTGIFLANSRLADIVRHSIFKALMAFPGLL